MILFPEIPLHFLVIRNCTIKFCLIKIRPKSFCKIVFRISRLIQEVARMANLSACSYDEIRRRKCSRIEVLEKCCLIQCRGINALRETSLRRTHYLILPTISESENKCHSSTRLSSLNGIQEESSDISWQEPDITDSLESYRFFLTESDEFRYFPTDESIDG
jgi:hypothetical protein